MRDSKGKGPKDSGYSRRRFLQGVGVAGVGALVAEHPLLRAAETPPTSPDATDRPISGNIDIVLTVNGQPRKVTVEPRTTLLNALRNNMDPPITGPKLVCDMGTCGGCTVLLDDKPVYGCLQLAIDVVGKKITTVEGIGTPERLSSVQAAFGEKDAMMCGFCTDGFVTSISGLLKANPNPTEQEVREACKGNFCRCGTYPRIFQAALEAAKAR
ncbi:MAG: (2Fe-2S)-binding protein [Tepidisphaeraceae bacterium]|jgi:aerobic-type carbon monoxide dehydrogenase small subunit (CoxS/CutS family)